ncbi:MAG: DUF1194 domain-containing protein [Pseudomonadota bacterium]
MELILAMDVSRSVMNAEYDLQMQGLAQAFRDDEVIDLIRFTEGGVMATVTQWSGVGDQEQTSPWRLLDSRDDALAFADEIERQRRLYFGAFTATGDALSHAREVSRTNPITCRRKVIDVSGDGASNRGSAPRAVADALIEEGYTINALAILGAKPNPLDFYMSEVIGGPFAFAEAADGFEDYPAAIRRKLLRELAPGMASR